MSCEYNDFEKEWEYQQGSLMLKSDNHSPEWRKSIAKHFWDHQQKRIELLESELKKEREAVDFYATKSNWIRKPVHARQFPPITAWETEITHLDYHEGWTSEGPAHRVYTGGKLARTRKAERKIDLTKDK